MLNLNKFTIIGICFSSIILIQDSAWSALVAGQQICFDVMGGNFTEFQGDGCGAIDFDPNEVEATTPDDTITVDIGGQPGQETIKFEFSSGIDNKNGSVKISDLIWDDNKNTGQLTVERNDFVNIMLPNEFVGDSSPINDGMVTINFPRIQLVNNQQGASITFHLTHNDVLNPDPGDNKDVPEPLTILGSATALSLGALLKREHSKKKKG